MKGGPTKPIPVRLPDDLAERLNRAAEGIGVDRSRLMRLCIEAFLADYEARGEVSLPLNWRTIMASFDGRQSAVSARHRKGAPGITAEEADHLERELRASTSAAPAKGSSKTRKK